MEVLIVLPAYNEDAILEKSVKQLATFCRQLFFLPDVYKIVIADNNSKDKTAEIGKRLASQTNEVNYFFIKQQGKGAAIKAAWQNYQADIYCFMDADLATDLAALPPLIQAIKSGADVAVGSRYAKESVVERSIVRKIFSYGYRMVLKIFLKTKIDDLPCGFKAITKEVKEKILSQVENNQWFFDTELVILAESAGYKIAAVPVKWRDPRLGQDKSRVKIFSLSVAYFKQVWKLKKRLQ